MKVDFLKAISERILVCDGAMGTMLHAKGIPYKHCFDEQNVSNSDVVTQIHKAYLDAGAEVLETNTFGANRVRLSQHGFEDRVAGINEAGVALAKAVAGDRAYVAGAIGPLGKPIAPIGRISRKDAEDAFREQIQALLAGEPDLLMIETISDLREMTIALETARSLFDGPIVAQMTFTDEGKTVTGDKPVEIVRELARRGADVIGANCSVGPQDMLEVFQLMSGIPDVRLSVLPNAGLPRYVNGRYMYLTSPEYMADFATQFVKAGAVLIGGCCGTAPEHVSAIARKIKGATPVSHGRPTTSRVRETVKPTAEKPAQPKATARFRDKLGKRFTVSVEIDPPKGLNMEKLIKGAILCRQNGVDLINVGDSPLARARMTPLALAHIITEAIQIETLIHVSCRDRNVLALQSEIMGAHALGMHNILAVTGDPPSMGDYPDATGVFDVNAVGLVEMCKRLNEGSDLAGREVDEQTDFYIGVGCNPTATDLSAEVDYFHEKEEAGAQFVLTQPLWDIAYLEEFLKRAKPKIPVMVGILPLRNHRHANFLHNEVPEMMIPESVRRRMIDAGENGPAEGVAIAQEFLREAKDMVAGTYFMPPFNKFEMAVDIIAVLSE